MSAQQEFGGVIGRDWRDSQPWWPTPVRPPAGAPNVVLIRNQVLPVDNRIVHTVPKPKPDRREPRQRYVDFPGGSPVPEAVAANVRNRTHHIEAGATIPEQGAVEGTLLAFGSALGGFSLHVRDGRLHYVHNLFGRERHTVDSAVP